jgi:hypothetical protein
MLMRLMRLDPVVCYAVSPFYVSGVVNVAIVRNKIPVRGYGSVIFRVIGTL